MGSLACATPPLPLPLTPTAVAGQTHLTREYVRERFRHRLWLPDLRPKSASCLRHAPSGGARQWHLCCVLPLSTRFRRSLPPRPPPHTHMPRGAILCRQLPEILHASSIRIIVAIVAHIELQMCVCVSGGRVAVRTRRNNNDATAKNEMLQRSARFLHRVLKRIAYLCV